MSATYLGRVRCTHKLERIEFSKEIGELQCVLGQLDINVCVCTVG